MNGEPYPARTVYHLLAGRLRYARSVQPTFLGAERPEVQKATRYDGHPFSTTSAEWHWGFR